MKDLHAEALTLFTELLDAAYALPADVRGWFDIDGATHPHNVCTEAYLVIRKLLTENELQDVKIAELEANNYHDAYIGARDDLLDWKCRAEAAEATIRKLCDMEPVAWDELDAIFAQDIPLIPRPTMPESGK